MEEKREKYLPIGTVVMLKGGKKRVMITGFCSIPEEDKVKTYDYSGCLYPEGFLSANQVCLFNHEQIDKIYYLGFIDEEEKAFKLKLDSFMKEIEIQTKQPDITNTSTTVGTATNLKTDNYLNLEDNSDSDSNNDDDDFFAI